MEQIKIGTCLPGSAALDWGKHLADAGFESVSINFHMECDQPDLSAFATKIKNVLEGTNVTVSSIGFYCNPLQDEEQRKTLERFIDAAPLFGTNIVTTFAGALEGESVEKAIPAFKSVFGELTKRAENNAVKIAFENCPMGGTWERTTCNIAFNPMAWEMMFNEVDSANLGLEWEPAHQMVQLIDPIPQLKAWVKKVVHMHGKDATVDWDAVRHLGVYGTNEFAIPRTPGFGDTNWRDIFFILYQNGYHGDVCVEGYHDPVFSKDWEMTGQLHALNYLKWCRGGDFTPNPW